MFPVQALKFKCPTSTVMALATIQTNLAQVQCQCTTSSARRLSLGLPVHTCGIVVVGFSIKRLFCVSSLSLYAISTRTRLSFFLALTGKLHLGSHQK